VQATKPEPAPIDIVWRWGYDKLRFNRANIILALGKRRGGKSVLLEGIAENYLASGHKVLDLFGAASGEGLGWLRSPWIKEREPLLIKGQNVDVKCSWHCLAWNELTLKDLERHDIIISASPFYFKTRDFNEEFLASDKILDLLMGRMGWRKYFYIVAREASKLLFSRKKKYEDQLAAKQGAVYLLQESRHYGLAMGLDAQKLTTIDSDIRSLCDYQFFKAQGMYMLPRELWFMFKHLKPGWLKSMPPDHFGILSANGAIGAGVNGMVSWHKGPNENLLNTLGIQVSIGEEAAEPANFRQKGIIRDSEHGRIIRMYHTEDKGMADIAKEIGRSVFIAWREIHNHNDDVTKLQYCPTCLNAKGEFARVLLQPKKRGRKEGQ
jgi:hypothetical protein